jgi:hypothetical protein
MTPEEIKGRIELQLAFSKETSAKERTSAWQEEQLAKERLWLQAEQVVQMQKQNELLARIAIAVELLERGG